jgi:hypothetical protein
MGCIKALYMEPTENTPLLISPQRNSSNPCTKWNEASLCSCSFSEAKRGPIRSLLNVIEGGDVSITLSKVSPLWRTILYKARYRLQCGWYQPFILAKPYLWSISNGEEPCGKKYFLVAITLVQKWESLDFQLTRDTLFEPIYFLCNNFAIHHHQLTIWPAIFLVGLFS